MVASEGSGLALRRGASGDPRRTALAAVLVAGCAVTLEDTLHAVGLWRTVPLTSLAWILLGLAAALRDDGPLAAPGERAARHALAVFGLVGGAVLVASFFGWRWAGWRPWASGFNRVVYAGAQLLFFHVAATAAGATARWYPAALAVTVAAFVAGTLAAGATTLSTGLIIMFPSALVLAVLWRGRERVVAMGALGFVTSLLAFNDLVIGPALVVYRNVVPNHHEALATLTERENAFVWLVCVTLYGLAALSPAVDAALRPAARATRS